MENEKTEKQRGGARQGAGRKKVEDRECRIAFGISTLAKSRLETFAKVHGLSLREAANLIFEALPE